MANCNVKSTTSSKAQAKTYEQWRDSRRPSQSDSDSELSTDSGYYTNALGLEGCGPAVQKVNLDQYRDPSRKHHRIHDPRKFDQELVRYVSVNFEVRIPRTHYQTEETICHPYYDLAHRTTATYVSPSHHSVPYPTPCPSPKRKYKSDKQSDRFQIWLRSVLSDLYPPHQAEVVRQQLLSMDPYPDAIQQDLIQSLLPGGMDVIFMHLRRPQADGPVYQFPASHRTAL